ncbi:TetR/AcrR family transcriptional regulator [Janibacter hoylei]|uniref:TetR/AcrR family transcriptional regulator n=1 Tax=Janibacter hoylei TaxID=364298 RepID=UPI0021A44E91|nr:TetR/AcrR family transcriptional regulator [Janibacter hoylei]MCT1618951.1 TetR/AcrR family transcriptional regulator [Janibacter hoylei]MCT2291774.1 TetR/AcrR family transcriptional regulator [Janibacter hoylei]
MANKARERLIASTIELQRRNGVAGMGINDVVAHSGAARRSIYLHFPDGKDQLVAEATSVAGGFIGHVIDEVASSASPGDALRAFGEMWRAVLVDSDFRAGCPVAAGALAGPASPTAPGAAGRSFNSWIEGIERALTAAGMPKRSAQSLAVVAVSAVEGAILLCISTRSTDPLDTVIAHLAAAVSEHLPTS